MANHAQITIIGHAGKDPESKYTPAGDAVCSVSVATSRKRKDKEQTSWWRVQAFGKTAEALGTYIHKGDPFGVVGEPVIEEWVDKEGQKRTTPTIYADRIILLGSRQDSEPAQHKASRQAMDAQRPPASDFDDSGDIPF